MLASTSSVFHYGTRGIQTLSDRRTFRARDLGLDYGAPMADDAEEDNVLYSKMSKLYRGAALDRSKKGKLVQQDGYGFGCQNSGW